MRFPLALQRKTGEERGQQSMCPPTRRQRRWGAGAAARGAGVAQQGFQQPLEASTPMATETHS